MRWLGNLCDDERTVKKFALFPIEANGEMAMDGVCYYSSNMAWWMVAQ